MNATILQNPLTRLLAKLRGLRISMPRVRLSRFAALFWVTIKEGLKLTCLLLGIVLLCITISTLIYTYGELNQSFGFAKARGYEMQIQDPYQPHRPKWRPKAIDI